MDFAVIAKRMNLQRISLFCTQVCTDMKLVGLGEALSQASFTAHFQSNESANMIQFLTPIPCRHRMPIELKLEGLIGSWS
jgi:hypothetical protein